MGVYVCVCVGGVYVCRCGCVGVREGGQEGYVFDCNHQFCIMDFV